MPAVTRKGDNSTGHGAFPPSSLKSGSSTVFVNGIQCGRQTDIYERHSDGLTVHSGFILGGSSTVFVEGLPIARVSDPISCGDTVSEGSPNVNAN